MLIITKLGKNETDKWQAPDSKCVMTPPPPRTNPRIWWTACPTFSKTHSRSSKMIIIIIIISITRAMTLSTLFIYIHGYRMPKQALNTIRDSSLQNKPSKSDGELKSAHTSNNKTRQSFYLFQLPLSRHDPLLRKTTKEMRLRPVRFQENMQADWQA